MTKINGVFLCNYKLCVNNLGFKIKLTLVRCHQRCKYYCRCYYVKVSQLSYVYLYRQDLLFTFLLCFMFLSVLVRQQQEHVLVSIIIVRWIRKPAHKLNKHPGLFHHFHSKPIFESKRESCLCCLMEMKQNKMQF